MGSLGRSCRSLTALLDLDQQQSRACMLPVPQALLDAMQGLVAEVRAVLLSGRRGASSSARQEALLAAVKRLHVHRIKVGADPLPTWVAAVVSRGQTGWPACFLAFLLCCTAVLSPRMSCPATAADAQSDCGAAQAPPPPLHAAAGGAAAALHAPRRRRACVCVCVHAAEGKPCSHPPTHPDRQDVHMSSRID